MLTVIQRDRCAYEKTIKDLKNTDHQVILQQFWQLVSNIVNMYGMAMMEQVKVKQSFCDPGRE